MYKLTECEKWIKETFFVGVSKEEFDTHFVKKMAQWVYSQSNTSATAHSRLLKIKMFVYRNRHQATFINIASHFDNSYGTVAKKYRAISMKVKAILNEMPSGSFQVQFTDILTTLDDFSSRTHKPKKKDLEEVESAVNLLKKAELTGLVPPIPRDWLARVENIFCSKSPTTTDPKVLSMPIMELGLSVRATNCLLSADLKTVGDIVSKRRSQLALLNGVGKKVLTEIYSELNKLGISVS
jgi:hypothetical protein